jgi:hypothetical protein
MQRKTADTNVKVTHCLHHAQLRRKKTVRYEMSTYTSGYYWMRFPAGSYDDYIG